MTLFFRDESSILSTSIYFKDYHNNLQRAEKVEGVGLLDHFLKEGETHITIVDTSISLLAPPPEAQLSTTMTSEVLYPPKPQTSKEPFLFFSEQKPPTLKIK